MIYTVPAPLWFNGRSCIQSLPGIICLIQLSTQKPMSAFPKLSTYSFKSDFLLLLLSQRSQLSLKTPRISKHWRATAFCLEQTDLMWHKNLTFTSIAVPLTPTKYPHDQRCHQCGSQSPVSISTTPSLLSRACRTGWERATRGNQNNSL